MLKERLMCDAEVERRRKRGQEGSKARRNELSLENAIVSDACALNLPVGFGCRALHLRQTSTGLLRASHLRGRPVAAAVEDEREAHRLVARGSLHNTHHRRVALPINSGYKARSSHSRRRYRYAGKCISTIRSFFSSTFSRL